MTAPSLPCPRERTSYDCPPVGVHVLGMHRSGTSATTRLLNLLGVPTCNREDLYRGFAWNEKGLWESRTMVKFNDALLRKLGAEWWCPPRPGAAWVRDPSIARYFELGRKVFERVHPTRQWVWKDPRTCVTLPFWLRSLEVNAIGILVLRHPLEIAASLAARNTFAQPLSLALWERYLQNVTPHLHGLPVLVTLYDDMLAKPAEWCAATATFLASHGLSIDGRSNSELIREFVDPSLRHHRVAGERPTNDGMSASQRALYDVLLAAVGTHDRFESPVLPVETPATDRMFAGMRGAHRVAARSTGPLLRFETLRGRPATPAPRPLASIVIISRNEGGHLRASVDRLSRTVSTQVELIVVDDASTDGSADFLTQPRHRAVLMRARRPLGVANARNLGARAAKGEIIILCDAHVAPAAGWFEPLAEALLSPGVGAVGPALKAVGQRSARVFGLTFLDDVLNVGWLPLRGQRPYPVPLLPGCFLAVRHDVFHDASGFDDGLLGYGAEDLDLCMRIWRTGLECLMVPASEVGHRFTAPRARRIDPELFLYNLLRLGIVHLSSANLTRFLDALRLQPDFDCAMARILAGDTFRRRATLQAQLRFDDTWFFRRFDAAAFRPTGGQS